MISLRMKNPFYSCTAVKVLMMQTAREKIAKNFQYSAKIQRRLNIL